MRPYKSTKDYSDKTSLKKWQGEYMRDELGYNELEVIGITVLKYYSHFLTQKEQDASMAFFVLSKFEGKEGSALSERLKAEFIDVKGIESIIETGFQAFRDAVALRVQHDHESQIFLNRCLKCQRITITPSAKWCKWCRYDWH